MRHGGAIALWLAWLLAACSGGDDVSRAPIIETSKDVGEAGATLILSDGTKLEIPKGALNSTVSLTVREVSDPKPLPFNLEPASKPIAFLPHGTQFLMPVKITLPAEGDTTEARPVKLDDEDDDTWSTVVGAEKFPDKLELETTSFSIYRLARPRLDSGVMTLPDGAIDDGGGPIDAAVSDAAVVDAGRDSSADVSMDAGEDAAGRVFADRFLEDAVRAQLGIPTAPLTQTDLDQLTFLAAASQTITSAQGLELCTNLTALTITAAFTDLTPILGLPLELLSMRYATVPVTLSELAPLTALTVLDLTGTTTVGTLSDLAPLTSLTALRIAQSTGFSGDLADLSARTTLQILDLHSSPVTGTLNSLSNLTSLRNAFLSNTSVSGPIGVFAPFPSMSDVDVSNTNVTVDFAPQVAVLPRVITTILASGVTVDCTGQANNIATLRGAGSFIDTDCD